MRKPKGGDQETQKGGVFPQTLQPWADQGSGWVAIGLVDVLQGEVEGIYFETVPMLEPGNKFWQLAVAGRGKNVHLWL